MAFPCAVGVSGVLGVLGVSVVESASRAVVAFRDGEGVCRRRYEPSKASGVWARKEPLRVGEASGCDGELPCLAAASAVNMSSSIAFATEWGRTCWAFYQYVGRARRKPGSKRAGRHVPYGLGREGCAHRSLRMEAPLLKRNAQSYADSGMEADLPQATTSRRLI